MSVSQKSLNKFEKSVCDLYETAMKKESRVKFWQCFQVAHEVMEEMGHEMQYKSPYTLSNRNKRRVRKSVNHAH